MNPKPLAKYNGGELLALQADLHTQLDQRRAEGLSLDLTRGKPGSEQLGLSQDMDTPLANYLAEDGTDVRNYGTPLGIPEARALGGELLGLVAEQVMAFGSSSLFLMYQVVETALRRGLWGDDRRWRNSPSVQMLAPVPGYDRHFTLCDSLNIGLIPVRMTATGPDMAEVSRLASGDASIKGIWCVPKYANPDGCIYSDETVAGLAQLPASAAADDFLVCWDNAYAVHDFDFPSAPLANLYHLAEAAGTEAHVALFASTSKITYASAGVGFCAGAPSLLEALVRTLGVMSIGSDKVNQLRHARFLKGRLQAHMAGHAAILKPKFARVDGVLNEALAGLGIATWTRPRGGYFVSLTVPAQTARRVVELAAGVGLTLTAAGATWPGGHDPNDDNIRIAPSFATEPQIEAAMQILALCVKLAAVEKALNVRS